MAIFTRAHYRRTRRSRSVWLPRHRHIWGAVQHSWTALFFIQVCQSILPFESEQQFVLDCPIVRFSCHTESIPAPAWHYDWIFARAEGTKTVIVESREVVA
jgi:hypothetical protein